MSWRVQTRYASLPGEHRQALVALDICDRDRRIASVTIRPDRDDAWHLKQASKIAAVDDLQASLKNLVALAQHRGRLDEYATAIQTATAALAKAEGR